MNLCKCGREKDVNEQYCSQCKTDIAVIRAQCIALDAVYGIFGGYPDNEHEEQTANELMEVGEK